MEIKIYQEDNTKRKMSILKDLIEIDLECKRAVFIGNKKQVKELKISLGLINEK